MSKFDQIVETLSSLTLMEAAELVKHLEEKWGVSAAAAPVMMAGPAGPAAPVAEEKTEFDVVMESYPADKKITILKIVREITALGLTEAKGLVESSTPVIKAAVSKEDADAIKKKLEAEGAKISLK